MNKIIWGVSAYFHDAGLSVIKNGKIVFAAHAERYSGVKHDKHLNDKIIKEALKYGEPDVVAWYEKPWKKNIRKLLTGEWRYSPLDSHPKKYMKKFGIKAPVKLFDHHFTHATAGYFTSPFEHAAVVVIDAIGEFETMSIWDARYNRLEKVFSRRLPHSLGLLYSAFTKRVGLKPLDEEYITMGMAGWGNPTYSQLIRTDYLDVNNFKLHKNVHKGIGSYLPLATDEDLACSIQDATEIFIDNIMAEAKKLTGKDNVVFMGGVALNCVANRILYEHFDDVWIMPNPGDCGSSLGAALAYYGKHIEWQGPYLGTKIPGKYPVDDIIAELKKNKIVGVASDRAEFGPRALGHRSLLADPRGDEIKDTVNEIKRRQKFRPFAPAILEEHVYDYFDICTYNSPFMQFVGKCTKPDEFPAIIHVDGSSRVQTVGKNDSPGFRKLLEEWYEQTGCPMLLNTSLNIRGEPMVNTKRDAKRFEKQYNVKVCS